MKTQTYGELKGYYSILDHMWSITWNTTDKEMVSQYKRARSNGSTQDDPPMAFPATKDIPLSAYSWVSAEGVKLTDAKWSGSDSLGRHLDIPHAAEYTNEHGTKEVTLRLDETPEMRRWMEKRDVNYLTRLAREGQLYEQEPHWESEVSEWVLTEVTKDSNVIEVMAVYGSVHPVAQARAQHIEHDRLLVLDKDLITCSKDGDTGGVNYLLGLAATDVNARDETGKTALMHAILGKHTAVIALLLSYPRIQLDCLSREDRSALHYAAQVGDDETVEKLLAQGVDPLIKDGLDKTPRDLAIASEHASAAALLRRAEKAAAKHVGDSAETPLSPASISALTLSPTPSSPASPATPLHREFQIAYRDIKLVAEIGKGGFGIVYRGMWSSEPVAVKQLHCQHFSPDAMAEFEQEAEMMVKLRNPRVTTLWGVVLEPGHYSLVMELMPKGSLFDLLHNAGERLDWDVKYRIAIDIGNGLKHLHSRSVLHRDLKSMNVLLDDRLRAKLTDFGLSRVKSESSASTRQAVGTLRWMAPELFDPEAHYTSAADVYSLGVILWELATRQLPYAKAVNDAIIIQWVLSGITGKIPEGTPYAAEMKACWHLEPSKRPDAASLVDQLARGFSVFQGGGASGAGGSGDTTAAMATLGTTSGSDAMSGPSYDINTGVSGAKSRAGYR